jgi:hypothetical protein
MVTNLSTEDQQALNQSRPTALPAQINTEHQKHAGSRSRRRAVNGCSMKENSRASTTQKVKKGSSGNQKKQA